MTQTIRALDLFCGAGGVARGLQLAGFHVTGVDINPQPRYVGDAFHQADAMTFALDGFDFIWASPPCQRYSSMKSMPNAKDDHPDLVEPVRRKLADAGVPWAIENVPGAPLARGSIMLCGTMFGLGVASAGAELRRHRWFETSHGLLSPECAHSAQVVVHCFGHGPGPNSREKLRRPRTVGVWGNAGGFSNRDGVAHYTTAERSEAMGIDWMTGAELSLAIPPAYSRYIAEQMMPHILARRERAA